MCLRLRLLAACWFVSMLSIGCGGPPARPAATTPDPQATESAVASTASATSPADSSSTAEASSVATTPAVAGPPGGAAPSSTASTAQPVGTREVTSPAAKAVAKKPPPPFSGKDGAEGDPIPTEVQRTLREYGSEAVPKVAALLTYPHPLVRQQACERLTTYGEDELRPQMVQALRGALSDPQTKVRIAAANSLRNHRTFAAPAIPELITLLADPDEDVLVAALNALEQAGPAAVAALPAIEPLLVEGNENSVRHAALDVIAVIGPPAHSTVKQLLIMLRVDNFGAAAGVALGKIGARDEILAALQGSHKRAPYFAAQAAAELVQPQPECLAEMLRLIRAEMNRDQPDESKLRILVEALARMRPTTEEVVAELGKVTKHESEYTRSTAVRALAEIDPKLPSAIPILLAAAADSSQQVAEAATGALGRYEGATDVRLETLLKQIQSAGQLAYGGSRDGLIKGAKDYFDPLAKQAADPALDDERRGIALFCLDAIVHGAEDPPAAWREQLQKLARQSVADPASGATLQTAAAQFLERISEREEDRTNIWIRGLEEGKFRELRLSCIYRLAGVKSEAALPAFVRMLSSDDEPLVSAIIYNLREYEAVADVAVVKLVELAGNVKSPHRDDIFHTLAVIGTQPDLSLPLLWKYVEDEESYARFAAAAALGKILVKNDRDPAKLIAVLKGWLATDSRSSAMQACRALGAASAPLVPVLIPLLDNDPYERDGVLETLAQIGPAAKAAGPVIVAKLSDWKERRVAIRALGAIQHAPGFVDLVPKLLADLDVREVTIETLGKLGPSAAGATPELVKVLTSPNDSERQLAVRALGQIGPGAKAAVSTLKVLLLNEEIYYRDEIRAALASIAPDDAELQLFAVAALDSNDPQAVNKFLADRGERAGPLLAAAAKSETAAIRLKGLALIARVKPTAECIPLWEQALQDAEPQVRVEAAIQLARSGRTSAAQVKALIDALDDEEHRWEIEQALQVSRRDAIEPLVQVLLAADRPDKVRKLAADTLASNGYRRRWVRTQLTAALASKDPLTQLLAAQALSDHRRPPPAMQKVLVEGLRQSDDDLQIVAIRLIQRLELPFDKPFPPEIVAALGPLMESENETVAQFAVQAMASRPFPAGRLPAVLELLESKPQLGVTLVAGGHLVDPQLIPPLIQMLGKADDSDRYNLFPALRAQGPAGMQAVVDFCLDEATGADAKVSALLGINAQDQGGEEAATFARLAPLLGHASEKVQQAAAIALARVDYDFQPLEPHLLAALADDGDLSYLAVSVIEQRADDADGLRSRLLADLPKLKLDDRGSPSRFEALSQLAGEKPEDVDVIVAELARREDSEELMAIAEILQAINYRCPKLRPALAAGILRALTSRPPDKSAPLWTAIAHYHWDDLPAESWLPALRQARSSDQPEVAQAAVLLSARFDKQAQDLAEPLLAMLSKKGDDYQLQYQATYALQALGPRAAPAVPKLMEMLDDPARQELALQVLGAAGPAATPAIPKLIELVQRPQSFYSASQALAAIGPAAIAAKPFFLELMRDEVRMTEAVRVLLKFKVPAAEIAAILTPQLDDPELCVATLRAIPALQGEAKSLVPALVKQLASAEADVSEQAAYSLGYLKATSASATPALVARLSAPESEVRVAAAFALGQIQQQPEVVVPALTKLLSDAAPVVRQQALSALGYFKAAAAPALPAMLKALDDPATETGAIVALGRLGPAGKPAVDRLLKIVTTERPQRRLHYRGVRELAAQSLGDIGPAAKAAAPALVQLYPTVKSPLKSSIGNALWKIDPAAAKQVGAPEPKQAEMEEETGE